jgi:hypothetical protein
MLQPAPERPRPLETIPFYGKVARLHKPTGQSEARKKSITGDEPHRLAFGCADRGGSAGAGVRRPLQQQIEVFWLVAGVRLTGPDTTKLPLNPAHDAG